MGKTSLTSTTKNNYLTLEKQAAKAFRDKKTKVFINEYLAGIRSNWQKAEETIRGSIVFLILLVTVFELLKISAIQEISIGPIKIADLSFIQKTIPALISYFFYSVCNVSLMFSTYRKIHRSIVKSAYPSLVDAEIEKFLTPPYFLIFGDITFVPKSSRIYPFFNILHFLFVATVIFGPLAYNLYVFYNLFTFFGFTDIIIWLALIIALALSTMGVLLITTLSES